MFGYVMFVSQILRNVSESFVVHIWLLTQPPPPHRECHVHLLLLHVAENSKIYPGKVSFLVKVESGSYENELEKNCIVPKIWQGDL